MNQKLSKSHTVFGLLVGLGVIWYLAAHTGQSDAAADPATSATLDANAELSASDLAKRAASVKNVISAAAPSDQNGNHFVVAVKQDSIFQGAQTSKDVLHTISNHGSKTPYVGVEIQMVETLVDRYGRKSDVPILQLDLTRGDVEKFNYDNIVGWDVLNVAQVGSLNPVSAQIVAQECAPDDSNAKYAAAFCSAAGDALPVPPDGLGSK